MRGTRFIAVAALAAGGLLVAGLPASAADRDGFGHRGATVQELARGWHPGHGPKPPTAGEPTTVAEHLAGPLTFDVDGRGTLYVGQAFAGNLVRVVPGQPPEEIAPSSGTDIAAVSTFMGAVTWSHRRAAEGDIGEAEESFLQRRGRDGVVTSVDLLAFERAANPDGAVEYSFTDLDPACAALVPPELAPYTGAVDSHAYGSLMLPGVTYVADAGANALLKVDRSGQVSTVAVLPPVPVEVTAEIAGAIGLPACVVGHEYNLEPVPTDVELGHDGWLYVSTLPGGPEDGSLGPIGSVYKVNPWTGR
ncbi:ScyD/ScyE family protein [Cellulomonas sp.]|uniref:ScyD/ScyE family protein n=1 Tax=Cellulomonas sp. TaxID=40001 RepID=UPI003BAC0772